MAAPPRRNGAVSELGVMEETATGPGTSMMKKLGGRLGMAGFTKRGTAVASNSTIDRDATPSPTTVRPASRTLVSSSENGSCNFRPPPSGRANTGTTMSRPASIYEAAQLPIVSPDASKSTQTRQIQQPGSLRARTSSNNLTGNVLSPPTTVVRQPGTLRHRASTSSLAGSASSATSPAPSATSANTRQPALRHRTSTSSLASAVSSSSAATPSLLPPRQRTISTTGSSLLPAPGASNRSISSSSVRSSTTATSSLSNSRRTSYGTASAVPAVTAGRTRTTSTISPPPSSNAGLRGVKTSVSRLPASSSSTTTHRRLGSLQAANRNTALSDFTPRPAQTQYSSFAASNGSRNGNATMSELEESPGLNELVANTTVQMADLKDMLSPLAVSGVGKDRSGRKESWAAPGNEEDEEEEELENVPSPSKPLQRLVTSSNAGRSLNTSKSSIISSNGAHQQNQLKKVPSLTEHGLPALPGMKRSPRQHVSLLSPPRAGGLSKQSDDISAILSGNSTSPSKFLSAETSTMRMRYDLANVALTPLRPGATTTNTEHIDRKRLAQMEEEKERAEAATKKLEQEKAALETKYEEQMLELERLKTLLASQAGDALRISKLESLRSTQEHDSRAFVRLQMQFEQERDLAVLEGKRRKVEDAKSTWKRYEKELELEKDQVNCQRETLRSLKEMLGHLEGAARVQSAVMV